MKKIVAIHQPNFFPWLGYFDKLARSDVFVLLDNVAYPKSGSGTGSWCNRVQINIQGQPAWVGCPIRRESGVQLIKNVVMDNTQPWRKKLIRTLEMNYRRSPYFDAAMAIIQPLIEFETDALAEYNAHAIGTLADYFGIMTSIIRQSDFETTQQSNELLIELIQQVKGTTYLCGGGASGYQEDTLFNAAGIQVQYQSFTPQPYGDEPHYLPGLSAMDYLLRTPPEQHKTLFKPMPLTAGV